MAIEKRSDKIEDTIGNVVMSGRQKIFEDLQFLNESWKEWEKNGMDTYRTICEVDFLRLVDKYRNIFQ